MNAGPHQQSLIPLQWTKPIASGITVVILFNIGLNLSAVWCIYNKRHLRNSSTAIIVANLACVDVLVTIKDLSAFFTVSTTGNWLFEENWCATYGLTNVIYIIVSVSTLITIATDRFTRLRELAAGKDTQSNASKPIILGYVIAHTTLSYSLSLLWSKYIFVTRKAFCRVEWPPRHGFSISFMSSFIFILPVSILIYNMLYKSVLTKDNQKKPAESNADDKACYFETKAQSHLQFAVVIFLLSWTPYVIESILSSYFQISPIIGIISACIPLFSTSLLPVLFMETLRCEPPKIWDGTVIIE